MLDFLLGHRWAELLEGGLVLGASVNAAIISGCLALIILLVWVLYRKTTASVSGRIRMFLFLFKSTALVILFICLLQPMLTTSKLIPQKRTIAVLVDNSRSMTIRDTGEKQSRGERASRLIFDKNGLRDRLGENFRLRFYRVDSSTHPISGPQDLSFKGSVTSLAQGLKYAGEALKGLPLSGLVLVTDGGDNSNADPLGEARILKSLGMPVFTVGVGSRSVPKDRAITRVTTARTVMEGAIVEVNVTVKNQGYENRDMELILQEGDRIIAAKKVRPENRGTTRRYTFEVAPEGEGLQVYTVRIPEEKDEIITENNRRSFLLNHIDKRMDILYIEGHPRNEYKFIQRAIGKDKVLRLPTYLQTGPQKFLRQGIESPEELASGYPRKKEDLYRYEAIILGDISGNFFTADQMAMTREFVSERGGGFLMLGGSSAFDEGFIGSPIADVLPVTLLRESRLPPRLRGSPSKGEHPAGQKFKLHLTSEGRQSKMLHLGLGGEMNLNFWDKMPQLQGVNVTGRVKPGATILAVHPTLKHRNMPVPVMAYQRYGRGRTMVITTASTWRWQMLMPHDDMSHERFWRQVLRWLAAASPDMVELTLDRDSYGPGDEVKVRVRASDETYAPINRKAVWLKKTNPEGTIQDIQLDWSIEEDGIYTGAFNVRNKGVYKLEVSLTSASGESPEASIAFLVSESDQEYHNAGMDAVLLNAIAEASGGKYYSHKNAARLADDLQRGQQADSAAVEKEIWDIPLVLFILFALFSLEWMIRRRRGLS
jgi:uncharacterized membrane protein